MAGIEVQSGGGPDFHVRVDGWSFAVSAEESLAAALGAPDATALVRASFEFLLEREGAAAILPRFDLIVIERYFPEWREEMRRHFG